jgi:type IV pilus assembly protein PilM
MRGFGEAAEVLRAGAAPVPEGALRSNAVADVVAVSGVIRQLVGRLGVSARRAVTAVPGPAVIVERMRLPLRPEDDLETVLMIEAASFIPESLDNVSLDYQVLRADQDAAEVLVVAVRKDILAGFTRAVTDAGLEPTVVDVDCFALESMFERNYETGPEDVVALINVGARYSTIAVVKGGRSAAVGDVQAGGAPIVEAVVEATGASCADAGSALAREAVLEPREAAVLERREAASSERWEAASPEQGASLQRVVSTRVAELADAIEESASSGAPRAASRSGRST